MPRAARPRAADDEPAPVGPPALEEPEQVVIKVFWGLVGRGQFWRGLGEALVEEVQRRVVRVTREGSVIITITVAASKITLLQASKSANDGMYLGWAGHI